MTVREAKAAAQEWVLQSQESIPNLVGVFVTGSIASMNDDDTFASGSDVDLRLVIEGPAPDILMEPAAPLAQRKLLFRGVLLEPICWSLEGYRNVEGILADVSASRFTRPNELLDPTGEIGRVQREVAAAYAKERWVRARVEGAAKAAASSLDMMAPPGTMFAGYASELIQDAAVLYLAEASTAVQIPCLADLGHLTFRKGFAAAREVYRRHGAMELYERLLEVVGSARLGAREAEALLAEYGTAFDCAVRVLETPFYGTYDMQEISRPLAIGGAWELVRNGFHRESIHFVATLRSWMQNAIENDGTEEEKQASRTGYARLLAALGISGASDVRAKGEALQALLPDLLRLAERVMAANPRIDRS